MTNSDGGGRGVSKSDIFFTTKVAILQFFDFFHVHFLALFFTFTGLNFGFTGADLRELMPFHG